MCETRLLESGFDSMHLIYKRRFANRDDLPIEKNFREEGVNKR